MYSINLVSINECKSNCWFPFRKKKKASYKCIECQDNKNKLYIIDSRKECIGIIYKAESNFKN